MRSRLPSTPNSNCESIKSVDCPWIIYLIGKYSISNFNESDMDILLVHTGKLGDRRQGERKTGALPPLPRSGVHNVTKLLGLLTFGFFRSVDEGGGGAGASFAVGDAAPLASGSGFGTGISGPGELPADFFVQCSFLLRPSVHVTERFKLTALLHSLSFLHKSAFAFDAKREIDRWRANAARSSDRLTEGA